ncbi:tyrosinase family oxidase copper chaperone [Streptomyces sp. B-S-A8]|uniref:Tyrosinase family oxidase copper chaperone n=2 Tax=Streptomyces solicavernae TaxID=3043614 RepID=A0ABT6RVI9_9ACTN|nr:tyrosinase family oxidase copper chaperone [Streptomyces sp. B-S-A8]MDI3388467.1 tyrosinase family oxidase copper chaperone [Streptomyces sp. B-S-A8]
MRSLLTLPATFTAACTAAPHDSASGGAFAEVYRGRWIQGIAQAQGPPRLFIDHRPLHLMRCADGGYVTPLDHYQSSPTPLEAARTAVDALGTAQLSRWAAVHGGGGERGAHGVHA